MFDYRNFNLFNFNLIRHGCKFKVLTGAVDIISPEFKMENSKIEEYKIRVKVPEEFNDFNKRVADAIMMKYRGRPSKKATNMFSTDGTLLEYRWNNKSEKFKVKCGETQKILQEGMTCNFVFHIYEVYIRNDECTLIYQATGITIKDDTVKDYNVEYDSLMKSLQPEIFKKVKKQEKHEKKRKEESPKQKIKKHEHHQKQEHQTQIQTQFKQLQEVEEFIPDKKEIIVEKKQEQEKKQEPERKKSYLEAVKQTEQKKSKKEVEKGKNDTKKPQIDRKMKVTNKEIAGLNKMYNKAVDMHNARVMKQNKVFKEEKQSESFNMQDKNKLNVIKKKK